MSRQVAYQTDQAKSSLSPLVGGILQRKCACGQYTIAGGECGQCEKNRQTLQRATQNSELGTQNSGGVPPIVHEVLRSPGQPLDTATRAFMEPRFGQDFSRVRVHTDSKAAESARAVNALAYTVGSDVVFGASQYSPPTATGQRLLIHELVHTIQQSGAGGSIESSLEISHPQSSAETTADAAVNEVLRGGLATSIAAEGLALGRVPCLPAASCPATIPASAAAASAGASTAAAPAITRRSRLSPAHNRRTGHGGRARQLEIFLDTFFPGLWSSKVHGIFVDQDFPTGAAAAYNWDCAAFTPPITGTLLPSCVFVPGSLNQQALAFNTGATTIGGMSREDWRVETLKTLQHEVEHVIFNTAAAPPPAGVTCPRSSVDFELSEISARIIEFIVPFRAIPAGAPPSHPARVRLNNTFTDILTNPIGNIAGSLHAMRCACPCADVDAYVRQTFDFTTGSITTWTATEKLAFNTELRKPSWGLSWPL